MDKPVELNWQTIHQSRDLGQYPSEPLVRFVKGRPKPKALEVGCGQGANLWMLAREGHEVYGVDIAPEAILKARKLLDEHCPGEKSYLHVGDMGALPFCDGIFDLIVDVAATCYVPRARVGDVFNEISRVMRPGGHFFCRTFASGFTDSVGISYRATGESQLAAALPAFKILDSYHLHWSRHGQAIHELVVTAEKVGGGGMSDIPIIFSGPMVRALLDGRKTMTRRLAWRVVKKTDQQHGGCEIWRDRSPWQKVKPGDRLWVREACWLWGRWEKNGTTAAGRTRWRFKVASREVTYQKPAGDHAKRGSDQMGWAYRHARYMPRWASRLTQVITATKMERLQNISDADAKAEGIIEDDGSEPDIWYVPGAAAAGWKIAMANRPALVFKSLWIAIHGERSWDEDPAVVALTFTVHQCNIDSMAAG